MAPKSERLIASPFFPIILIGIALIPLAAVDFPPLVDVFGHLGRYAIQTDLANRPELHPYFSYEWQLVGNLGVDLIVQFLTPLIGLEPAVKCSIYLTQLVAATGILSISKTIHGRITPFSICALPLIYSYPFQHGFLNFCLSMALAMLAFSIWLVLRRRRPGWLPVLFLLVAGLLVWLCHAFGWAFLGILCGTASLHERWQQGYRGTSLVLKVIADCAVLLLALVPMLLWRSAADSGGTGEWAILRKIMWAISVLRSGWAVIDLLSAGFLMLVIGFGIEWKPVRMHGALALAALACLVFFLILPARLFGSFYADMRLFPYTFVVALLALTPTEEAQPWRKPLMMAALGFFALRIGVNTVDFIDKDREGQANLQALDAIPVGARVVNFAVEDCGFQWRLNPMRHLGSFAIARRSAFTNDQWEISGANALTIHYPAGGEFVRDPSQTVTLLACPGAGVPSLAEALGHLPVGAFTHVWIHGTDPAAIELPFPARAEWRGENGVVFAVWN